MRHRTPLRQHRAMTAVATTFVAVIGLHSSGSSCLAGVLHRLGLHFGRNLGGHWGTDPTTNCGFEADELRRICEEAIPFPNTGLAQSESDIAEAMSVWVAQQRAECLSNGRIPAGKYPLLCRLGQPLIAACGDALRVIHIERPLEESIRSLIRREEHLFPREAVEAHQRWLWEGKQELLSKVEHLTVQYANLLADPRLEAIRLVDYLGVTPTSKQLDQAVAYVRQ